MQVLSEKYYEKHTSPIIRPPRKLSKPPEPIEGLNDSQISDLIKVKLNIGKVRYDISPRI